MLSVRGLTKRYGDVLALDGVDLDVTEGQRAAIVGPSGSGKTTLLRVIAGFETPETGTVTVGGETLNGPAGIVPPHLRRIGYVAQDGVLFPHLSVRDNVGFGIPRNADGRDGRILELMDSVGLTQGMAERRPHELSGGQQQRVALARALAQKPRLVLLDEPFSALDAGLRASMRNMVQERLARENITSLLVTHDQAEAISYADHLGVMRAGRMVHAGPPRDIYLRPGDAETARFLGDAIIFTADLSDGLAVSPFGRFPADNRDVTGRMEVLLRPEQIAVIAAAGSTTAPKTPHARVVKQFYEGAVTRTLVEMSNEDGAAGPPDQWLLAAFRTPVLPPGSLVRLVVSGPVHVLR